MTKDLATGASDHARVLVPGSDAPGAPAGVTENAGAFIALNVSCLDRFGTDMSP